MRRPSPPPSLQWECRAGLLGDRRARTVTDFTRVQSVLGIFDGGQPDAILGLERNGIV